MPRPAREDPPALIDEINRANLPKVFGELLFLMEDRTEPARTLYRPEEPFLLPGNVWFIGTMNTADRSVAIIDAAMRRRFHFVPFFPHDGPMKNLLRRWLGDRGGRIGVADLLDAVNEELLTLVGEHLLIGPSHFMKTDLSDRALARIWTYNVFPLIEEQLWGDRDTIARWRWDRVRERFAAALSGTAAQPAAPSTAEGSSGRPSCPSQASHGSICQASITRVRSNAPGGCQVSKQSPTRLRDYHPSCQNHHTSG